jgi:hypothetical protein
MGVAAAGQVSEREDQLDSQGSVQRPQCDPMECHNNA